MKPDLFATLGITLRAIIAVTALLVPVVCPGADSALGFPPLRVTVDSTTETLVDTQITLPDPSRGGPATVVGPLAVTRYGTVRVIVSHELLTGCRGSCDAGGEAITTHVLADGVYLDTFRLDGWPDSNYASSRVYPVPGPFMSLRLLGIANSTRTVRIQIYGRAE